MSLLNKRHVLLKIKLSETRIKINWSFTIKMQNVLKINLPTSTIKITIKKLLIKQIKQSI
jgi:hypothetical protein